MDFMAEVANHRCFYNTQIDAQSQVQLRLTANWLVGVVTLASWSGVEVGEP